MPDVPVLELPDQPSLEHLRKQAKDLRRAEGIGLSAAQLAVARQYGFASWTRAEAPRRAGHRATAGSPSATTPGGPDPADEFLRLACLTYADDHARTVGAGAAAA